MKKTIIQLYFLPLFLVFVSIFAWEFWLEPLLASKLYPDFQSETLKENWEYIITVFVFCAIALLFPLFLALKLDREHKKPLATLKEQHKKTTNLLKQFTIKLAKIGNPSAPESMSHVKLTEFTDTTQISLQTLIDSISDTLLVIDTNYHVRMLNKAARDLYLGDSHNTENPLCHKLSHNEDSPCEGPDHECPFRLVMESGKSCTVMHVHFNKDGNEIPFEIQASPIFDSNGSIIGIVELARDISSRLDREHQQRNTDTRLFELERQQSVSKLAGGLAHEFNNILTSILGNAELLSVRLDENDLNTKQVESIINGCEELSDLSKQLLAFAKGGKNINQIISVNELISNSLHLLTAEQFSDTKVELYLADDLWQVSGDPSQVNQLIVNILINGFEALEKIDGKLLIHTFNENKEEKWQCKTQNTHPPGDYVLINVTNTGSAIADEIMDKIFDPFFSTKYKGRGMGLSAAMGIIKNHNGCITVENHSDQTTFQVLLPRTISDIEIIKSAKVVPDETLNLKVLVVDDEFQVLSTIKSLLNHQGCIVLSADKGIEALEIIERHKADLDLVILDIQMPDMSGDKVYGRLKKIKPDLKVLISSGYDEFTALKSILLEPGDKFIKKPFRMSELMLKMNELMAQE
jgi:nitrogen-specific signal transduction histidine kinase/ActR/RegA family two-component response regulator